MDFSKLRAMSVSMHFGKLRDNSLQIGNNKHTFGIPSRTRRCIPLAVIIQYWKLYSWRNFRLWSGYDTVPVNWSLSLFSPGFAIFENDVHVHSLEPVKVPSYSASHQAQNYVHVNHFKLFGIVTVRFQHLYLYYYFNKWANMTNTSVRN